ncbi:hypothetical protein DPMN_049218 [Dreissena polymorpha]|uniref:Uncharacterized protein n=1 Tax=Dreissena polymorpha TaxID=45954 RepID=A0A9D4HM09_DREPO|nr:hypothetical protein DPMN_049218 [Dreissena polymorpha]
MWLQVGGGGGLMERRIYAIEVKSSGWFVASTRRLNSVGQQPENGCVSGMPTMFERPLTKGNSVAIFT